MRIGAVVVLLAALAAGVGVRRRRVLQAVRVRRRDVSVARRQGDALREQLGRRAERAARHVVRHQPATPGSIATRSARFFTDAGDARDAPSEPVAAQRPALRPRPHRRRRRAAAGRGGAVRVVVVPVQRTAISSSTARRSAAAAGKSAATSAGQGSEMVAFRLHLPSKVHVPQRGARQSAARQHPRRGSSRSASGARQTARAAIDVASMRRMDPQSILYRTLQLFGATFAAVAVMFGRR